MAKAVVIDGNHTVHRIWNTNSGRSLTTKSGKSSGVVHGFLMSLCTISKQMRTPNITVVWDHRSSHRTNLIQKYNESQGRSDVEIALAPGMYKESRYVDRTDADHRSFHEGLLPQMRDLQYIVPKLGVRQLTIKGVEGDDLIGLSTECLLVNKADEVIIVSSDHDLWQLLGPKVRMYDPIRKKFFSMNDFKAKYGVGPEKLPEIRALSGDPKDDIPGIPRVGEKTAAKWIAAYGGLNEVMRQASEAPKTPIMSTLPNYTRQVELAYNLSYILNNLNDLEPEQARDFIAQWQSVPEPDWAEVQTFTDIYELRKVWLSVQEIFDTHNLSTVTSFEELWEKWGECKRCPLYKTRTNIVKYGGSEHASIMLLGEGPGATEDFWGSPFVGKAGRHMRKHYFNPNGLSYEQFHITNMVCCRPTTGNENRAPTKEEMAACGPRLKAQIRLVDPQVIVLIGDKALKHFFPDSAKISTERGLVFNHDEWPGISFIPVFHPSYLMRLAQGHSDVVKSQKDWAFIAQVANSTTPLDKAHSETIQPR